MLNDIVVCTDIYEVEILHNTMVSISLVTFFQFSKELESLEEIAHSLSFIFLSLIRWFRQDCADGLLEPYFFLGILFSIDNLVQNMIIGQEGCQSNFDFI